MMRFFGTKPRIPSKILFDDNGERLIIKCPGFVNSIRGLSIGFGFYLYGVYSIDKDSASGTYRRLSLGFFSLVAIAVLSRASKLLYRLILVQGGQFVKIDKYPWFGFGHLNRKIINIVDIKGVYRYGKDRWYNPMKWGRNFYRLNYKRSFFFTEINDYAIFRIPKNVDKDIFRLIAAGKPVNDKTLKTIAHYFKS